MHKDKKYIKNLLCVSLLFTVINCKILIFLKEFLLYMNELLFPPHTIINLPKWDLNKVYKPEPNQINNEKCNREIWPRPHNLLWLLILVGYRHLASDGFGFFNLWTLKDLLLFILWRVSPFFQILFCWKLTLICYGKESFWQISSLMTRILRSNIKYRCRLRWARSLYINISFLCWMKIHNSLVNIHHYKIKSYNLSY